MHCIVFIPHRYVGTFRNNATNGVVTFTVSKAVGVAVELMAEFTHGDYCDASLDCRTVSCCP